MNTELFLESLGLMGKGMAGIFLVMVLIALIVAALTKITAPKKKKDE